MGEATVQRAARTDRAGAAFPAYHWALGLFVLLGAVQIFFAGLGMFSSGGDPGFEPHRLFSTVIAAASFVVFVLAVVARAGARHIAGTAVVLVLSGFAQHLLAFLGSDNAWLGGLHALTGLAIVGVPAWLFWTSGRRAPGPPTARYPGPVA
jgi:Family of unknown function (DUF6220)